MKFSIFIALGMSLCTFAHESQAQSQAISCNLDAYQSTSGIEVTSNTAGPLLRWRGTGDEQLQLQLTIVDGEPVIRSLQMRDDDIPWRTVLTDARIEFDIVEGFRRISNQQLVPLRALGIELTQEVVDRYKWDVFWDAPLDLREQQGTGNPPPLDGVAQQPGLPRSSDEIRRNSIRYNVNDCIVISDGARVEVRFPGVTLGSFSGELTLTVYVGTNLIRTEVLAATQLPSVAYKYDVGLSGLDLDVTASVAWRDTGYQQQSFALAGPANENGVPVTAANRLLVATTNGASIAAFPPPHTFFWAREVEINVGYNWYRKDSDDSFSIGIRQGEQEVVERYMANWSLYSAPPGSQQQMVGYFYPSLSDGDDTFQQALAFTHNDVYKALNGYKVMGSHYHTDMGRNLIDSGSIDTRLRDFEVIRSAGIDIAGPVDRPREETQLQELHWLFEGAIRHSDADFMVWPQMENSNILGGHWDLLFSHPVYYVDERAPGTPLVTEHSEYGKMYNIGSAEDIMAMVEAENMLIYMPHPRTKGSTGYPDAVANSPQFLHDSYRGAGWRWGMGSDLSEKRLSDFRVIPLLDDMNNWLVGTGLQPKSLIAITETYFKAPGDDIYANGPVTYLKLDELPVGNDYSPIIDVLKSGDYFVTSGEVLISSHEYIGSGDERVLLADVEWTFPLDFVEVVYGDGLQTISVVISATHLPAFGSHTFEIPFNAGGQAWVRFAAWDSAGNGAMTMPVWLE
ncbi:MAG: hypothetical protein Q8L60_02080 [Gammaproteobacteria bacterium]|nr:hypothetical protein [Gammaproteobacteria bacterium]MDP2142258.1 hypothetical protein [Gammaproteobacteria bacterium]MDP2347580.1 hypothetical protein [Gammaproteobacteria bacterium]